MSIFIQLKVTLRRARTLSFLQDLLYKFVKFLENRKEALVFTIVALQFAFRDISQKIYIVKSLILH